MSEPDFGFLVFSPDYTKKLARQKAQGSMPYGMFETRINAMIDTLFSEHGLVVVQVLDDSNKQNLIRRFKDAQRVHLPVRLR